VNKSYHCQQWKVL